MPKPQRPQPGNRPLRQRIATEIRARRCVGVRRISAYYYSYHDNDCDGQKRPLLEHGGVPEREAGQAKPSSNLTCCERRFKVIENLQVYGVTYRPASPPTVRKLLTGTISRTCDDHSFSIKQSSNPEGAMAKSSTIYQLKITLQDVEPAIWRRVQIPDCSLEKLHLIVQPSMGWSNYHLWSFKIAGENYGDDPDGEMGMSSPRKTKLGAIVDQGVKKFSYVYDFGDNWEHEIKIEKVLQADPKVKYPRCLEGARACPPEDCGGPWGYPNFIEAVSNPAHAEHEEMLEWIGGKFDPEAFDPKTVNRHLAALR
jgi:hypothetical protein